LCVSDNYPFFFSPLGFRHVCTPVVLFWPFFSCPSNVRTHSFFVEGTPVWIQNAPGCFFSVPTLVAVASPNLLSGLCPPIFFSFSVPPGFRSAFRLTVFFGFFPLFFPYFLTATVPSLLFAFSSHAPPSTHILFFLSSLLFFYGPPPLPFGGACVTVRNPPFP